MVRAMPRRLPSQGPCPLARCPSRGEDAVLPKVRSAALGRRLRAVLASLRCVARGWWFSDGHVSSCSNAGESSLALELPCIACNRLGMVLGTKAEPQGHIPKSREVRLGRFTP